MIPRRPSADILAGSGRMDMSSFIASSICSRSVGTDIGAGSWSANVPNFVVMLALFCSATLSPSNKTIKIKGMIAGAVLLHIGGSDLFGEDKCDFLRVAKIGLIVGIGDGVSWEVSPSSMALLSVSF